MNAGLVSRPQNSAYPPTPLSRAVSRHTPTHRRVSHRRSNRFAGDSCRRCHLEFGSFGWRRMSTDGDSGIERARKNAGHLLSRQREPITSTRPAYASMSRRNAWSTAGFDFAVSPPWTAIVSTPGARMTNRPRSSRIRPHRPAIHLRTGPSSPSPELQRARALSGLAFRASAAAPHRRRLCGPLPFRPRSSRCGDPPAPARPAPRSVRLCLSTAKWPPRC